MAEITCDQVGHENEVTGLAIPSGAGLGGLDQSVYGLHGSIAQGAFEAVEDTVPVRFQGQGELLEGCQLATARPSEPGSELFFGLGPRGRGGEDVAQGFLQAERTARLQVHSRQRMVLRDLLLGPLLL